MFNQPQFRDAPVIVVGANFGSGSSREQAVWALLGRGTRAVIAESFGEIFFSNCLRNGILPIALAAQQVAELMDSTEDGGIFTVNLEACMIQAREMEPLPFPYPPERRLALLNGCNETDQIINQFGADIAAFEMRQRAVQPWLFNKELPQ